MKLYAIVYRFEDESESFVKVYSNESKATQEYERLGTEYLGELAWLEFVETELES